MLRVQRPIDGMFIGVDYESRGYLSAKRKGETLEHTVREAIPLTVVYILVEDCYQ